MPTMSEALSSNSGKEKAKGKGRERKEGDALSSEGNSRSSQQYTLKKRVSLQKRSLIFHNVQVLFTVSCYKKKNQLLPQ
jgi:hypothetical protein